MKKYDMRAEEQKQKPRRLSLSRETIRLLADPALLELARGGWPTDGTHSSAATCTSTHSIPTSEGC